jgi:2-phosphosulfolactate phosphatase
MSNRKVEVLFTPAEFEALHGRDLSATTCVVFDILRATSSIITALANGAAAVIPVEQISEAVQFKSAAPTVLLAGERDGFRITSQLTGNIDFDLGNSPREFKPERVRGKTIVLTTTNGTRALKACGAAGKVLVGSFLNMNTIARHIRLSADTDLLLICSGTHEEASYEDTLAAGSLVDLLLPLFKDGKIADSAHLARNAFLLARIDLEGAMQFARNGRRLLGIPELREDVAFCLRRDVFPLLAQLEKNGRITPLRLVNEIEIPSS